MAQTFAESDLLFSFPDTWAVRKFDETVAYQSMSGHGLKGVDFIARDGAGTLWLIEVKNYRPRVSPRNGREYRAERRTPADLAANVAGKFTDSHRLLRIIVAYIRRHWYRRFQLWWQLQTGNDRSNYRFWSLAAAALAAGRVRHVLWLETPEGRTHYDDAVATALRELLPGGETTVVETGREGELPFGAE